VRVAKTPLGRGLAHLMGGAKPANSPGAAASGAPETKGPTAGPGFTSLLQGQHNEEPAPASPGERLEPSPPPARSGRSLFWVLLAADGLFIVLALWLMVGRSGRPGRWEILLSVLALGLGAWLACYAVLARKN
jgi:hypothetical protein